MLTGHSRSSRIGGFTLIELLIVVAVLAVLAYLAMPAYQESVRKSRRADAQASLMGLTIAIERYYMEQSPSTYVGATLGNAASDIYPNKAPLDGSTKFYNLALINLSSITYTATAAPTGRHSGDKCGTLSVTQSGVRAVTGQQSGITWQDCWR